MKTLSALVLLLGMLSVPSVAQTRFEPRGGFEFSAGGTYLTVPKGTSRRMDAGGVAGAFAIFRLTTLYKLQPEIQYEYRRSKILGARREFEYVTVPLLVRMDLFKGIYLLEGPAAHFPRRAKVAGQDVERSTRSPDLSLVIAVGKRVGRVGLEGRWDSGIWQVQKTVEAGDVPTRHRSISGVLAILLGG